MSDAQARPLTAAGFNLFLAEHKLAGTRCPECGNIYLPPRAICPACQSSALVWEELSGSGKIAAFTSIFVGPSAMVAQGFDRKNPYVAGIVTLDEGVAVSARILGVNAQQPEIAWIGRPVSATFLDEGEGEAKHTVLAFEPVKA
jgi:uncharacterized OB-fold protein